MSKNDLTKPHPGEAVAPFTDMEWRDQMLEMAGITKEDMAESVQRLFAETKRLMHANEKKPLIVDGSIEVVEVPDNQSRLRAIDTMIKFIGVQAPANKGGGGNTGQEIHVHFPDIYRDAKDVTPKEVLDVQATQSQ